MSAATTQFDAAIIGGGPAGLSAALMLVRVRRKIVIFDSKKYHNAPSKEMHAVLGSDGRNNEDFCEEARKQISAYGTAQFVFEEVTAARGGAQPFDFVLTTASGAEWHAKTVLLAGGVQDELLPIPGLATLWNADYVHHCMYCLGWEHKNSNLAALGTDTLTLQGLFGSATLNKNMTLLKNAVPPAEGQDQALPLPLAEKLKPLEARVEDRTVSSFKADDLSGNTDTGGDPAPSGAKSPSGAKGGPINVFFSDGSEAEFDALLHHPNTKPSATVGAPLKSLDGKVVPSQLPGHDIIKTADPLGRTEQPGVCAAGDLSSQVKSTAGAIYTGHLAAAAMHDDLSEVDLKARA
jgi:thioredoxin reductase